MHSEVWEPGLYIMRILTVIQQSHGNFLACHSRNIGSPELALPLYIFVCSHMMQVDDDDDDEICICILLHVTKTKMQ